MSAHDHPKHRADDPTKIVVREVPESSITLGKGNKITITTAIALAGFIVFIAGALDKRIDGKIAPVKSDVEYIRSHMWTVANERLKLHMWNERHPGDMAPDIDEILKDSAFLQRSRDSVASSYGDPIPVGEE